MEFVTKTPINKGWSDDRKYCVTDEDGKKYLLRVSDISTFNEKKLEFDMMKRVASLGVPMCLPLELYTCDEGVHFIQSWIDGEDAGDIICGMSTEKQYGLGVEAGQILRKIHSIAAPDACEDWESSYNRKLDRKINNYRECPLKYENGQAFIDYINANRHLLKNRPQVYQHGDFHRGNLMMGKDGKLYVIDFGRNDYGDPWEDLKSITWDVELSPIFAKGRIDGYFGDEVPNEFWRLFALYIFCGILACLPWAIPFGKDEVQVMLDKAEQTLKWYEDLQTPVPNWY